MPEDFMEIGDNKVVALENGWFLDKKNNTKFTYSDDGEVVYANDKPTDEQECNYGDFDEDDR